MKKFSEHFNKQAQGLHLKANERKELRDRLLAYMDYHPLQAGQSYQALQANKFKWSGLLNGWFIGKVLGATATLCLVIIPVLAEKALPGDVLYPVKVSFNEEVRSNLALSPYEKVQWETTRLERRIAEARLLANEGKLTPEVEAEVAEAVRQHSDAAQKEIASIRESDSEEAAIAEITLASALEVQSEVLEGHTERDASSTESGRSVAGLSGAVNAARDNAVATQSGDKASYKKLAARIETETTQAQELFYSIGDSASVEEVSSIEQRLANIQIKIGKAAELYNTPDAAATTTIEDSATTTPVTEEETASSTEDVVLTLVATSTAEATAEPEETVEEKTNEEKAIVLLRSALADTQKLISFMTDIDVRLNVSIDDLVPVELDDTNVTEENSNNEEDQITDGEATTTEAIDV